MNPVVTAAATAAMAFAYKKYLDALKHNDKRKADEYLTMLQNNSGYSNFHKKIKNT